MVVKFLFPIGLFLLITTKAITQNSPPRFGVGIESQYLFAGEINASFDFFVGVRGQYLFTNQGRFTSFVSAGLATDIVNSDARTIASDVMIGRYWHFNKKLSGMTSVGGQYFREAHRFELINEEKDWQNTTIGITGRIGFKYDFSDTISSTLFLKQINLTYTAVGVGVQYSF